MPSTNLINQLANMAGTDNKGESRAAAALQSHAASLFVSLAGEANPTIKDARDEVAVAKARRSLRTAKTVQAEAVAVKLSMKAALKAATDEQKVDETPTVEKAPKAKKAKRNGTERLVDGAGQLTPEGVAALQ